LVSTKLIAEARKNGISDHLLRTRLRRGWSEEDATTEPPTKKKERGYWLDIAKKNGVGEKTFDYRVYYQGLSYTEAALKPVRGNNERKYWLEIAKKNGISVGAFNNRVHREWGFKRAATEPINKRQKKKVR